jgi:hypothetical protein
MFPHSNDLLQLRYRSSGSHREIGIEIMMMVITVRGKEMV